MLTVEASAASARAATSAQWSRSSIGERDAARRVLGGLRWNAGVSSSRRRMSRPATTTTALSQNGIRQPQLSSWSSGSAPIGRKTAVAMTEAGLRAAEREAREERAPVVGRVLEGQRVRAGLLAGGREALQQPQRDEQRSGAQMPMSS